MDEHGTAHGGEHAPGSGHEESDIRVRPIAWAGAGLTVIVVLIFVLMRWTFVSYMTRDAAESAPENPLAASYGRQVPPEPRLQTHPVRDLRELRAAEDATLTSYGWVDRKAGIVRIPIARAMELLVSRGGAARPDTGTHP
jgi:hypothetical protein